MKFSIRAVAACAAVAVAGLSGCAMKTPPYSPSIQNVSALKEAGTAPVAVGTFTVKAGIEGGTTISMRANSMSSPIGADYAAYLAEALRVDLDLAKRLDPRSTVEITGVLLRNDLDASGISKGVAQMEAQFIVRRDGQVRFDKVKKGATEWESSFAAAIAIPKAVQSYPYAVQSLLNALVSDADFQAAIR